MKRLIKSILKAAWRWTAPVRHPLLRKLDGHLARSLHPTERLIAEQALAGRALADETMVLMDQVVREIVRLQRQVDELRQAIEDLAPDRADLTIAGEIAPGERLKAG